MPRSTIKGGSFTTPGVAKTASYTLKVRDSGKIFTNRGATGTITFTLPKIVSTSSSMNGIEYEFFTVAAQIITVASDPVDKMVTTANVTANAVSSIAAIGTHFRVVCDGTSWLVEANPGTVAGGLSVQDVTVTA